MAKPLHQRSHSCGSAVTRREQANPNRFSSPPHLPLKQSPVLELNFHRETLFSSNLKLKSAAKEVQFRITFANPVSANLTAKDKSMLLASLDCKRVLSESYFITPTPSLSSNPDTNRSAILSRRSLTLTKPKHQIELIFPSICQTDYPLFIGDKVYSWRPLLISPSWVLVDARFPTLPLAKFKRHLFESKLGRLSMFVRLPDSHFNPLILALGFILYRHRKPLH